LLASAKREPQHRFGAQLVRWTDWIIAHRKRVIALWVVVVVLSGAASAGLGDLLTNRFSVPGSEAERGRDLLGTHFQERGDGDFTLVAQAQTGTIDSPGFQSKVEGAARRGAAEVDGARAGLVQEASPKLAYVQITTPLENDDASNETTAMRRAIGDVPGAKTYLSGAPAVNHDTESIYNDDLKKGETIAVPIALLVLLFMFGTLGGAVLPLAFALATIPTTLGIVWIFAHFMDMAVYVQNIVTLIGLAIAIDYSMLIVFRYREQLDAGDKPHEALRTTMATAGRATLFSGMTVAVGLALLVLMPLPFMRSMGVGGLMVPLVSIFASATLLPALLAVMGRKINRLRLVPRRLLASRAHTEAGFWNSLARSIMRRPITYLAVSATVMLGLAAMATRIDLTSGDNRGVPTTTESTKGLALLAGTLGPGALSPNIILVDTGRPGGVWSPASVRSQRRLAAELKDDPEVQASTIQAPAVFVHGPWEPDPKTLARLEQANLVDPTGELLQFRVAGRHDTGTPEAVDLVHRLRDSYVPEAGFRGDGSYVTGAPAFGVDFLDKAYGAFPWLIAAVLVLSYLLLLRAFRSVVLPLKAVFMNLLSVSATYGVLVLLFQDELGKAIGFQSSPEIDGWIPIFLFAMLFGLSMDYEVFLLSRMREEWDSTHDNEPAVARGLERTGRIITAAAIIMIAAFSGFMFGSFVGLQEFGAGLAAAILLDATVVRMVLVPATMKLLGDWNWYLPDGIRRALRLQPQPAVDSPGSRR
jgi:RND superfamily putative drug exporter